jgi:hypothetical protein
VRRHGRRSRIAGSLGESARIPPRAVGTVHIAVHLNSASTAIALMMDSAPTVTGT